MFRNIRALFNKQATQPVRTDQPCKDFASHVQAAIEVIVAAKTSLSDAELFDAFINNGIPKKDAIEILLFLPIAFVRQLLPGIQWPDTYITMDSHKNKVQQQYANTAFYKIIFSTATKYINSKPGGDAIIKMAGRSAEFHAINQLLLDNPSLDVNKIKLTETVLIQP